MLVLADDLTGAADTGGAFAMAGHRCTVVLDHGHKPETSELDEQHNTHVLIIDADSRAMTPRNASAATTVIVCRYAPSELFVKIDSTLRGHVRATVDAALAALPTPPSRVVMCPAFPKASRTVLEGRVHVHGEPLDGPNLREIFADWSAAWSDGVLLEIPDVRTDDDLSEIVRASAGTTLWVGSAGLAYHLGRARATGAGQLAGRPPHAALVVVVAGSQHERTTEQVTHLAPGTTAIVAHPDSREFATQIEHAARGADGLVLTGGATARKVLEFLNIDVLEVGGEVEPGVPWAVATGPFGTITIVTKAGGFGDALTLQRAVQFLTGS